KVRSAVVRARVLLYGETIVCLPSGGAHACGVWGAGVDGVLGPRGVQRRRMSPWRGARTKESAKTQAAASTMTAPEGRLWRWLKYSPATAENTPMAAERKIIRDSRSVRR